MFFREGKRGALQLSLLYFIFRAFYFCEKAGKTNAIAIPPITSILKMSQTLL